MNLIQLRERGFKIDVNWQDCNNKSIFLYDRNDITKFTNYVNLALKM